MNKKGKKGFLKKLALCAVSMSMLVCSVGCAGNAQGGPPEGRGGTAANTMGAKVAVICKNDTVQFWDDVHKGAEDACEELGLEMMYKCASGDNDYASQVGYIKEAIEWGADAIIVAPNGVTELNDAFAEAQEAGIALVNINSKADFDGISAVVRSSDKDGGTIAGKNAAEILLQKNGEEGFDFRTAGTQKIGIIGHTAETANERITAFKDSFGTEISYAIEDYKSTYAEDVGDTTSRDASETAKMIESYIVEGERCSGRDTAKEEAMKLMKANPEIKVLYGTNTNTTLGICDAIKEMEQTDKVFAIGFNSSEDELNYIRQGVLKGTVIQNPYNMGYLSVTNARSLIAGTSVSPVLDTGVTFVDADNLNDDIIQLMLNPDKIA
jgi:ribose transport system substrate-binding protein